MRAITEHKIEGLNEAISVTALDEPGAGGACHVYEIVANDAGEPAQTLRIEFQNGPIKEAGVNGISNEALIAVVLDRMRGFCTGPYYTQDNDCARMHLENALMRLHKRIAQKRAKERLDRGVEGTSAQ